MFLSVNDFQQKCSSFRLKKEKSFIIINHFNSYKLMYQNQNQDFSLLKY
ncbi:hypothetical protein pb186bvf_004991 [Paramecium bursaria]